MLNARALSTSMPSGCTTLLDEVCRRAIARARTGQKRLVAYVPPSEIDVAGCWNAEALERTLALLVEEALLATRADERVELRWRADGEDAVLRVKYPRPLGSGERIVTFSDADAAPGEDRRRLATAREALLELGGTLARVRTTRGTTYVVTVPRAARGIVTGGDRARLLDGPRAGDSGEPDRDEGEAVKVSLYVAAGPGARERLARLARRAEELMDGRCSPAEKEAVLHGLKSVTAQARAPELSVAVFASRDHSYAVVPPRHVPDLVAVGPEFHSAPLRDEVPSVERRWGSRRFGRRPAAGTSGRAS